MSTLKLMTNGWVVRAISTINQTPARMPTNLLGNKMTETEIEVANLKAIVHNLEALKVGYAGNIRDGFCKSEIQDCLQQAIDATKYEIRIINQITGTQS